LKISFSVTLGALHVHPFCSEATCTRANLKQIETSPSMLMSCKVYNALWTVFPHMYLLATYFLLVYMRKCAWILREKFTFWKTGTKKDCYEEFKQSICSVL